MTIIPYVPEPPSRFERSWGVIVGSQSYRADVLVITVGFTEAPAWMVFTFADNGDGQLNAGNFVKAVAPGVAVLGFELLSAELHPITEEELRGLGESHIEPLPNRATRRALA